MSVINKMLRDLDQRQASGVSGGAARVAAGTRSVDGFGSGLTAGRSAGVKPTVWLVLLSICVLAGLALGWLLKAAPATVPVVQLPAAPAVQGVVVAPTAAPLPATVIEPAVAPVMPAAGAKNQTARPSGPVSRPLAGALSAASMPSGLALKIQADLAPAPIVVLPAMKKPSASTFASAPLAAAVLTAAVPVVAPLATTPVAPKPVRRAALEVLVQAQTLWQEGAQTGAVELLHGALLRLDAEAGAAAVDPSTIAAMAREYARMSMAQNQVADALSMLTRLESQLSGVADIWALRGSAAQRLGQHRSAAQAYSRALLLRPDEPRWMLAAAVSLAAQGQIGQAAELAEKARKAGGLPPDVANYLRQLGVAIQAD